MIGEAFGAWIHFLSIFAAVGFLGAEIAVYRPEMNVAVMTRLRRLDAGYGLAALAIIVTGLLRVFFFGKGVDYYVHNHVFWTKMGLFILVALLSIPPTIHFPRAARRIEGGVVRIDGAAFGRNRAFLFAEAALFVLIPLMATLMARGIG